MIPDLLLFTTDANLAVAAVQGGAGGIVIDWERRGKAERQLGADTLVSQDTPGDLERIRAAVSAPVVCRVDAIGSGGAAQIEEAIALGADEVLLPMVREPREVSWALDAAAGRCGVGVMLETREALNCTEALAVLPVTRFYVGLNDLAIERGTASIFTPLIDGTIERLRAAAGRVPLGFAGLTVTGGGSPIPSVLLLAELLRLRAGFTFLRRSFWRDVASRDATAEVAGMRAEAARLAGDPGARAAARRRLVDCLAPAAAL